MGPEAKLAGEADLAEGGERPVATALQREPARGAREGERYRQVGARLLDADAAGHRHEHVARAERDAAVPGEHREDERQAVAIDPVADPARLLELRRRDESLHLHEQRAGALHGA